MVNMDNYIMEWSFEDFKNKILTGITDRPAYCVEIMQRAFGRDYSISPILSNQLANTYERAIKELLASKRITEVSAGFKNTQGQITVFTTSYKLVHA